MKRLRAIISYHGAAFSGWQVQPHAVTVQGCLESALKTVLRCDVRVHGAGRTDAGVHARGQVAHFDIAEDADETVLLRSLNALTPEKLSVLKLEKTSDDFDARRNPHKKTYVYRFDIGQAACPIDADFRLHYALERPIFEDAHSFLSGIEGTHDFASFCSAMNSTPTTVRTLLSARLIWENDRMFSIELCGKGFLHHMVRIVAGTVLELCSGERKLGVALSALNAANRRDWLGRTLPAKGLCLESINYFDME